MVFSFLPLVEQPVRSKDHAFCVDEAVGYRRSQGTVRATSSTHSGWSAFLLSVVQRKSFSLWHAAVLSKRRHEQLAFLFFSLHTWTYSYDCRPKSTVLGTAQTSTDQSFCPERFVTLGLLYGWHLCQSCVVFFPLALSYGDTTKMSGRSSTAGTCWRSL